MPTIDFTPLFRSTVGFDRMQRLMDSAMHTDEQAWAYPPYNIEAHGEDAYRIVMAVAGFDESELDITVKQNRVIVSGKAKELEEGVTILHRGIAGRSFERHFDLADNIKVTGAALTNGLLRIDLAREVPEEQRPRKIPLNGGKANHIIEGRKAS